MPSDCNSFIRALHAAIFLFCDSFLFLDLGIVCVCFCVHFKESKRAAAGAKRFSVGGDSPPERPPSVITFHASVARTFGRSARLLDVDLEARTVVQVRVHARRCVSY